MHSSEDDVNAMLLDLQAALCANKMLLIPRKKNLDFMSRRGLLWADVRNAIHLLTFSDYISGPDQDRDFPSSDMFWIFKTRIDRDVVYVKFKILYQEDGSVKVVSFHLDEPWR